MAELTDNLLYKECNYLYQLYIGNPIARLIISFKRNRSVNTTVPEVSASENSIFKLTPFARVSDFNGSLKSKIKDINSSLFQALYKVDPKTFLWVLFSNVCNFIIIGSLVN